MAEKEACLTCGEWLRRLFADERKVYAQQLPEHADLENAGICPNGHLQWRAKAAKAGK